jgi:TolB-like protein/DNA-binding winged helix-turn-helix (wHTH) protein
MANQTGASYQFGEFYLDGRNQELRRKGEAIKLPPQPFRVLALLVSRAGELVTRAEIEGHLWGPETTVDFRQGLNSCILHLREVLGDDARAPRFIATVPRRGYKFVAPVERVERRSEGDRPALLGAAVPRPSRALRWLAATAVAATLLLSVAFVNQRYGVESAAAALGEVPGWVPGRVPARVMVAVLPFQDLSSTAPRDSFAEGLTDEVIALLGRPAPERLGVIARTAVLQYRNTDKDIREIGRELGVAYVVEGSVRREGSRARISAQLIRVEDQAYLWCQSYDRELAEPLKVQKEVGGLVARTAGLMLDARTPASSLAALQ